MDILSKSSASLVIFLSSILSFPFSVSASSNRIDVSVMTFNLRVPVDAYPNDWVSRKPRVISVIKNQHPDFLGVQEAVPEVLLDINNELSQYSRIGRGRNADGKGEGTQIFYKKSSWKIDEADQGTLQLSPTPDIAGSNGWEMQFPRIFTWARLIEKKSGKAIYIFNTHFPLVPKERLLSSILLARAIADRKHPQDPVVLSGDFNACEIEDSIQYFIGTNAAPVRLLDSYRLLHPDAKTGTFHDFGKLHDSCKVDYILMSGEFVAISAEIIKDDPATGFASDHYAVAARLRLATGKDQRKQ